MTTNPYMPQNTAAPSAALADSFKYALQTGDYAGAASLGRTAGYSDADIAGYVGQNQFKDSSGNVISGQMANDYLGQNQPIWKTQNTAAPSAALADSFKYALQTGNYAGAASLGRSAGYSDADIAGYVGQNQFKDSSGNVVSGQMANDYLGQNQPIWKTQNLGMGSQPAQSTMQSPMDSQSYTQPESPAPSYAPAQSPAQTTMQTNGAAVSTRNPYLQQQGNAMQAQSNQNLLQNVLPSIGRGAQAAGMYGSSRQGIAEGQAIGNAQTGLNSALAGMYSQGYGQDQSYDLGLRSNDLGYANLDANINQNNFGNQLQSANFGLGVYDRMNGYNQQNITNATNMQNTPMNYFNNFNSNANQIAGQGGTSTNSQVNPGNPYIGALGGLQLGSQIWGGK